MKVIYLRLMSCIAALALVSAVVPNAAAQCGMPSKPVKPANWLPQSSQVARLQLAAFDDDDSGPSIVGMWHAVFTGETVNGGPYPAALQPVDNSLVVWHSDGTEIMNSNRPAQDGNFCLGVWKETSKGHFLLNHIPWAGNDMAGGSSGIGNPQDGVQLTEEITLAPDGKSYTGHFTLVQYNSSGNVGVTITGSIAATRVTPTTPFTDLL
jgi:hypothetical protein